MIRIVIGSVDMACLAYRPACSGFVQAGRADCKTHHSRGLLVMVVIMMVMVVVLVVGLITLVVMLVAVMQTLKCCRS